MTRSFAEKTNDGGFFLAVPGQQNRGRTGRKPGSSDTACFTYAFLPWWGVVFFMTAYTMAPLITMGFGWLYFAIMGLITICMGVVGSVFNTYASLYLAKDNDQLLSMPIPSRRIIFVRLFGVFIMGLLYDADRPCAYADRLVYERGVRSGPFSFCTLITSAMISLFVLVLSAVLGWVVALISGKMRRKNITTVLLSLVFLVAYFLFYSKAFDYLQAITSSPEGAGAMVKNALYPLLSDGACRGRQYHRHGHFRGLCLRTVCPGIRGSLPELYQTCHRQQGRGDNKIIKARRARMRSADTALLIKEMKRFTGSAVYIL